MFAIEILVDASRVCNCGQIHPHKEWRKMKPTHGQPYRYETREEAERVRAMCYPDATPDEVRIKEVSA